MNSLNDNLYKPEYTNKCDNFSGTLDYIFYTKKNLILTKILKIPDLENQKIPNNVHSSDHVPLMSEFIVYDRSSI